MMRTVTVMAWMCMLQTFVGSAQAEPWPSWRGPRGDGTSRDRVAIRWNGATGENVVWKVPVPGEGVASPIVWNDRVFLTSCLTDTGERVLISFDAGTGEKLWQRPVFKGPLETKHALNSYASSTPATDGRLVFVSFLEVDGSLIPAPNVGRARDITPGEMVVAAYDFEGQRKWLSKPGSFVSAHGYCSNPVVYEDLVIVNGDHDGESYVVALAKETGEIVWRVPREYGIRSYVTPLIREIDGRTQMVFSGSQRVVSLDPRNGSTHWYVEGPTEQFVASMVYDGQLFFMAAGFPTYHVMGIRPDGRGEVTETHVEWHVRNARCYVPSPVVVDNYLFVADDRGTANCFDTSTGKRHWQARLGKHFSASLVAANGLVFFTADDGRTKVVRPGPALDVIAENELGETTSASAAIADGRWYVRGEKHLFCIGHNRQ